MGAGSDATEACGRRTLENNVSGFSDGAAGIACGSACGVVSRRCGQCEGIRMASAALYISVSTAGIACRCDVRGADRVSNSDPETAESTADYTCEDFCR